MAVPYLDRIDAVPLAADAFSNEYKAWVTVLVDSLNSAIQTIEDSLLVPLVVTTTAQQAQAGTNYIIGNALLTTVTLPVKGTPGDTVQVTGTGAGGWVLATNAGQTIYVAASSGGTSVASAEQYDTLTVQCTVTDTTWVGIAGFSTGYSFT